MSAAVGIRIVDAVSAGNRVPLAVPQAGVPLSGPLPGQPHNGGAFRDSRHTRWLARLPFAGGTRGWPARAPRAAWESRGGFASGSQTSTSKARLRGLPCRPRAVSPRLFMSMECSNVRGVHLRAEGSRPGGWSCTVSGVGHRPSRPKIPRNARCHSRSAPPCRARVSRRLLAPPCRGARRRQR